MTITATIPRHASDLRSDEARAIGTEAFLCLYPLVMDATRRQMTNLEGGLSR